MVAGMRVALAPWICVMDADFQHPPETIERLVAKTRERELDLVAASRLHEQGSMGDLGPLRRALSRLSSRSAALSFRRRLRGLTDPMSRFFLVRREAIDLDALEPRGFKILLEILVRTPGLPSTRFRSSSGSGTQVTARHLCARAGAF